MLLLPFDVAARVDPTAVSRFTSVIDTPLMWQICLWTVAGLAIVVVPFATFYYEAYDPDNHKALHQLIPAIGYTLGLLAVFLTLDLVLWFTVGFAVIPYFDYQAAPQALLVYDTARLVYLESTTVAEFSILVSFFVYTVALLCFVGWILFSIYGGIGLVALPIDTVSDFINRPKAISRAEFTRELEAVNSKAEQMLKVAQELLRDKARGSVGRGTRSKINVLRAETMTLEDHLDRVVYAFEQAGGSPFVIFGALIGGILGGCLSIMWLLQILLNNALQITPLLNIVLIQLDEAFTLLGVIAYGIFAYYLLLCTFKGQIKFGLRVVFFQIHPMKVGDTLMNAFLFNVGIILVCSVAVVQFCAQSFSEYAANTTINALLNLYVRRLKGIGLVIFYLQYVMMGVALLSIFWVILCPRKRNKESLYKPMSK